DFWHRRRQFLPELPKSRARPDTIFRGNIQRSRRINSSRKFAAALIAGLIAIVVNTAMIETPLLLTSRPDWAAFSAHSLRQPQGRSRDGTPHSRTTQRSMRKMPVLGAERKRGHDGRMQTLSSAGGDGPRGRRCPEHCELGMAADARRGMVRRMDRPKVPHAAIRRRLSILQSPKP